MRSFRRRRHPAKLWCAAPALLCLSACALDVERLPLESLTQGYERATVIGDPFLHTVFRAVSAHPSPVLHVYIEHDGQPWLRGGAEPAADPTPRRPVMLELMRRDRGHALYLGRPCYFGLSASAPCTAMAWTLERYSEMVVNSMAAALRAEMVRGSYRQVRLFGHSGGGTLAVLLAYRIPEVRSVITLAANLSVEEWARLHGYSLLEGSLDPMRLPALSESVEQMHFVGERDVNTPVALLEAYVREHAGARMKIVKGIDHLCCWDQVWPEIIRQFDED